MCSTLPYLVAYEYGETYLKGISLFFESFLLVRIYNFFENALLYNLFVEHAT